MPPTDPPSSGPAIVMEPVSPTHKLFERVVGEVEKIFVGQAELVLGSLVALFSSGHVLIESVPGLGKTLFVRTLGRVLGCQLRPHPVHRRPDALRHHRGPDLRPEDAGVPLHPRPRLHAVPAGRRD